MGRVAQFFLAKKIILRGNKTLIVKNDQKWDHGQREHALAHAADRFRPNPVTGGSSVLVGTL